MGLPGRWTEYEINLAKEKGVRIVPVLMRHGELPDSIEDLAYIDETGKGPEVAAEDIALEVMHI